MKQAELTKLLAMIAHRRAILKELENATKLLEAKLEEEMRKGGIENLDGGNGSYATFTDKATVKAREMAVLLRHFDARTMAALLQGSSINQGKQKFLERAIPNRNFRKALVINRSASFSINLPRTKEQKEAVALAIKADVAVQEKDINVTFEDWENLEKTKPLPHNPKVNEALKPQAKAKKSVKKKAGKKKALKKKALKKKKGKSK